MPKEKRLLSEYWQQKPVLLSLVGGQPSELAVKLATLEKANLLPEEVVLFPSQQTLLQAERLQQWASAMFDLNVKIRVISADPMGDDGQTGLGEALKSFSGRAVVCACDGGRSSHVALMAYTMGPNSLFLHSDVGYLYAVCLRNGEDYWSETPLASLGLQQLMNIYAIDYTSEPLPPDLPRSVNDIVNRLRDTVKAERLKIRGLELPRHLAYEHRGRLHILFDLLSEGKVKENLRRVASLPKHWLLKGLRPVCGAILPHRNDVVDFKNDEDFKASNLHVFGPEDKAALCNWMQSHPPRPGQQVQVLTEEGSSGSGGPGGRHSLTGKTLVVALGNAPMATLVSLATHKPERAVVVYDSTTPQVLELKRRMEECQSKGQFGLKHLEFIENHHFMGFGLPSRLATTVPELAEAVVDVTPGSKGQTRALAWTKGAQLWCLDSRRGLALRLNGQESQPLNGPALETVMAMTGGMVGGSGKSVELNKARGQFFQIWAELALCALNGGQDHLRLDQFQAIQCGCGGFVRFRNDNLVEVSHRNRTCSIRQEWNLKNPFEEMTAHLLSRACPFGDFPDETRLNLKWAWSPGVQEALGQRHNCAVFRAELDVAVRFRNCILVVSCKAGDNWVLDKELNSLMGIAEHAFGRLPVSALVQSSWSAKRGGPSLSAEKVDESIRERRMPVRLSLRELADPDSLNSILKRVFEVRNLYS